MTTQKKTFPSAAFFTTNLTWIESEFGSPLWEAGEWPPGTWYGRPIGIL